MRLLSGMHAPSYIAELSAANDLSLPRTPGARLLRHWPAWYYRALDLAQGETTGNPNFAKRGGVYPPQTDARRPRW